MTFPFFSLFHEIIKKFIDTPGNIAKSFWYLISYFIFCVFNYLFQILVGRNLGPEQYGLFCALFSIIYLFYVFIIAMQTSISWHVAGSHKTQEDAETIYFFYFLKKNIIYSLFIVVFFLLLSPQIMNFLHLTSSTYIVILSLILGFSFLLPIPMGILQGTEKFNELSITTLLLSLPKFLFILILFPFGFGIFEALLAQLITIIISFVFSILLLRKSIFKQKNISFESLETGYHLSTASLICFFCLTLPSNLDVIFVTHQFSNIQSGIYASASIIGKIILFSATPISTIFFPKIVQIRFDKKNLKKKLILILSSTTIMALIPSLLINLCPWLIHSIFDKSFSAMTDILFTYSLLMILVALLWALTHFLLAMENYGFCYIMLLLTIIEYWFLFYFTSSIQQMIFLQIYFSLVIIVVAIFMIYRKLSKL